MTATDREMLEAAARSMNAVDVLARRDEQYKRDLQKIGSAIGYGNAQHILGQLWDEMLHAEYGVPAGRGAMGVTIDDDLPPLPKAANKRRKQGGNGSYCMVPAYTEDELKAYARAAQAKEREACADEADHWIGFDKTASDACDDIAQAIRSRGAAAAPGGAR